MNGKFNGNMIDTTSVMVIVNKLNLYIENEEKIIQNIENSLSLLSDYYSGNNSKIINGKVSGLYFALSLMLDNRRQYVDVIRTTVNRYVTQNENITSIFNDL